MTPDFTASRILKRDAQPWQTVEGIEFRSLTIEAFKGKQGECFERNQAVIYKGPFKEVLDDDGHRMERGQRYAVCDKTFQLYRKAPYQASSSSSSRARKSRWKRQSHSIALALRCAIPRKPKDRITRPPRMQAVAVTAGAVPDQRRRASARSGGVLMFIIPAM